MSKAATYHWVPEDVSGSDLDATPSFSSQAEAESWMGREWESLLAAGAEHVKLVGPDGSVVYRMGLREA